ncbi:MAG TPA: AMP-binding protein [Xanthobacteraceae bacterium]|nr:AMP-binding protein [Xanthobacteraceae bacterium]
MPERNPFTSTFLRRDADDALRPQGRLSYVAGRTDDALKFMTVPQLLDRACARHGAAEAANFPATRQTLSWYDLRRRADDVAAGLLALGIGRGDRVCIWSPNRVEWLDVQFGTARIGAILAPIDPADQVVELEHALRQIGCKALIMARGHAASDHVGMIRELAPEIDRAAPALSAARLPRLAHVVVFGDQPVPAGAMRFADLARLAGPGHRGRLESLSVALDPDDAIIIPLTSGTAGAPNGTTLSHFGVVNNARYCAKAMALTARDRLCVPLPLHHCLGMVLGVLCCTTVGAAMVFPGETFDAAAMLAAITRYGCTALHGVPAMFIAALEHPEIARHDVSSLRTGIIAGASCPTELMRRVVSELHMREVTIAYGMTETGLISFQSGVGDPVERRVSTIGRIHPHVEAKIVDAGGRVAPVGTAGELCTRGYSVMCANSDDPERAAQSIDAAGWMHSGDLAVIDAEGFCNIVGRVKDMVIHGRENIQSAVRSG